MEGKIIEYGIILLHKCGSGGRSNSISLFFFLLTNYKNVLSDRTLHFPNTFSYFFQSKDITSLGNIHPITF